MDRWNIVASLNYLPNQEEENIILSKLPNYNNKNGKELVKSMVQMAGLTRKGFMAGDISCVMSPRTVLTWAENNSIFESVKLSFCLTFLNKCDEEEKTIIAEYYQRCFGEELDYALTRKTA
jgi:cobaltochelatase CobS